MPVFLTVFEPFTQEIVLLTTGLAVGVAVGVGVDSGVATTTGFPSFRTSKLTVYRSEANKVADSGD